MVCWLSKSSVVLLYHGDSLTHLWTYFDLALQKINVVIAMNKWQKEVAVIDISFDSIKSFYELMISFEWREKKSLKQKLIRKNWQTLWKRNKTKESIDGNLLSKWSDDTRLLFTMCIHVYEINLFSRNCYSSWNF